MTTVNSVNTTLSGQTGTGSFVGSTSATIATPLMHIINDTNGNQVLNLQAVSSAVNYINIVNNSTGVAPSVSAGGSDTNINVNITPQGTGFVEIVTQASGTASIQFVSGTGFLHRTQFIFPTSVSVTAITFPDASGTILLTTGTQQMASSSLLLLDKSTGTESANAVTISKQSGVITTTALTTAQYSTETITLTNTLIGTGSVVIASIMGGSNTTPGVTVSATAGSGTSTIVLTNTNSAALNGTVIIGFAVF